MSRGQPISLYNSNCAIKPSLGSAIGLDCRINSSADETVSSGCCRRRYAIMTVTERDLPMALDKLLVI